MVPTKTEILNTKSHLLYHGKRKYQNALLQASTEMGKKWDSLVI
jgi:hypothetical protein